MEGNDAEEPVIQGDGVVVGAPRRWLGLEGLVLLIGALIGYATIHQPWWLVPAGILVPDLTMSGYLAGTHLGAHLYNFAHATFFPAFLASDSGRPTIWLWP